MSERSSQLPPPWSTWRCRVASGLLAYHLLAVFCAPWHSPPPASYLSEIVNRCFAPYQAMTFLDHGYRFFAPDPGPSHLVRYELVNQRGETIQGQLPDPRANRSRLLYHRYFMITETLFNIWSRIETVPANAELTDEQRRVINLNNERPRQLVNRLARGIAHQLLAQQNGTRVRLYIQEHLIPLPEDVEAGRPLNDPELFQDLADLGEFGIEP